MADLVVQQWR